MKTCHPERKNGLAKPSNFGVEGTLRAYEVSSVSGSSPENSIGVRMHCSIRRRDVVTGSFDCARLRLRELSLRSG